MSTEFHLKYRPTLFKHVIGQPQAVQTLQTMVKANRVPHVLLFTGPSGVGKTTLARILKAKLECGDIDFKEINAANVRGIDGMRDLISQTSLVPMQGKVRIYLIDECASLTKDAQQALLKPLEDTPKHQYWFLATTDPAKLLKTIITRCTEIRLQEMQEVALRELIVSISEKEKMKLSTEVVDKLIECSTGSARMALVILNKLVGITEEADQIEQILKNSTSRETIEICRLLLKKADWKEVAEVLKVVDGEPEQIRRMILGYMQAVVLNSGQGRAFDIMNVFQYHFYDSGKAGLVAACYGLCMGKR